MRSKRISEKVSVLFLAIILMFFGFSAYVQRTCGQTQQYDLPFTIRIYRTGSGTLEIVPFETYVKRVLPNEWIISQSPLEALKAGAVAIKMYGWYYIINPKRYDARAHLYDDSRDQVYSYYYDSLPSVYKSMVDEATESTWLIGIMRNGEIFPPEYWSGIGYVSWSVLNIRDNPGKSSKVIGEAYQGDKLYVLSNGLTYIDGYHWFFIKHLESGKTGWVAGEGVVDENGRSIVNYADRMTQYGTVYWAEQGKDYKWILQYFYPNIQFFDASSPSPKFKVGDRVQTTGELNVRSEAFINPVNTQDNIIWTAPSGSMGTIKAANDPEPQSSNGYTWWYIEYDSGYTGWSSQHRLAPAETTISAQIVSYYPSSQITVEKGKSFTIQVQFKNTGTSGAYFYAGASIWDSNWNLIFDDWSEKIYLGAGEERSVSWTHTINAVGEYYLQFGVWDETKSKLLDKKPSPAEKLIKVVESTTCPYSCWDRSPLSGDELAALVRNHFPLGAVTQTGESIRVTAYAVAKAESGGNPSACGDNDKSIGLWQINIDYHPEYDRCRLFEEDYNANAANEISQNGKDWNPWCTWEKTACGGNGNEEYKQYLTEARKHFYPKVTSLSVSKTSINLGEAVRVYYSVSDDVGLARVELWRATDKNGAPDNWAEVSRSTVSGTTYSGYFDDYPESPGVYWYGIHVIDNSGAPEAWNDERNSRTGNWPGIYGPIKVNVAAPFDDKDGKKDLRVFRPSNGYWYALLSSTNYDRTKAFSIQWGVNGDVPLVGDLDGDGKADLMVWRPSNGYWYALLSSTNYDRTKPLTRQWGTNGDKPLIGDIDGDGKADIIVWRPSNGYWYALLSSTNYDRTKPLTRQWGISGDIPLIGDLDKDGRADIMVFRPSNGYWYALLSSTNYDKAKSFSKQWGISGDIPLVGDIDGDGKADLIVFRPSNGYWYALLSSAGYDRTKPLTRQWGASGDRPLIGDIDGDGKMDIIAWRPSNGYWYALLSGKNYDRTQAFSKQWGTNGDVPI
ncbi:MAG: hypothetical protein DSO07_12275 [Thermoproteota archaeon]|uniref:SH3b domain-containing protein n=1 Tax=Candidatus Methanodesulfokora washburnensis TaxID=2478471 RepID=A0A3R9RB34_9CREN|nr:FG-GAP-like repeat-containing protein [Candidatus Methanodesulfokores washburnensis]RSN79036.1 hypothetical protein D6D85_00300 [Candidatus Methanodesulfokores washburnensis]TDA37749.1 MAG: hypothetical protein DSO07_12275 [Candidatus Korarchaeota archaeon]